MLYQWVHVQAQVSFMYAISVYVCYAMYAFMYTVSVYVCYMYVCYVCIYVCYKKHI